MRKFVCIEKLPSGNYSVRYWNNQKFEREWFSDYSLAKRRAADLTLSLLAKRQGTTDPTLTPLDIYNKYIEAIKHTHRAKTLKLKEEILTPFLVNTQHLTVQRIKEWKLQMMSKLSISTVSIRLRELRAMCNWAKKEGYLQDNLFEQIEVPAAKEGGHKPSLDTIKKIWQYADPCFKPFLGFLIYTGARYSEIHKTQWQHLDLNKSVWHIPAENCKTNKERYVPIPKELLSLLKGRQNGSPFVFAHWADNTARWYLKKACKKAAIPREKWPTPHTFRHAFASYWDGDIRDLMDWCGWTTMLMPKRYTHNNTEDLRKEAEKKGIAASLSL